MTAPATREEFLDLVRRSEVLDNERLDSFAMRLSDSGAAIDQPHSLAQRMIRDGLLTAFQAKQLLAGKWRRFRISGKYKLLELIGAGGMGQVFLCEHVFMRRLVALKVLPIDKLEDQGSVQRFYREARAVGALDHPNIVRAYDIDQDDKLHFLVMEYVDGESLQNIVARHGPMDPAHAANYIRQAALGLQHSHEAKIVHRDIKPGNLLLDRSGVVKVLDLGLARFFDPHNKDNLTRKFDEGATLGTADYLAPEQAMNKPVDIRADIYSLGATFFFLLTGKAPFEDGTLTQKLLWHQLKEIESVADVRNDVPPEMAAVIQRMLAKSPDERPATPQEVANALTPWATGIETPPANWFPKRSPAAMTAGAQGDAPMVPVSPPRSSVQRTAPLPQRNNNSTPTPKTTLTRDVAPNVAASRNQRKPSSRRLRSRPPQSLSGRGKMIAMIVGGSLVSLGMIFGIVWATLGKRDHGGVASVTPSSPSLIPPPTTGTPPVAGTQPRTSKVAQPIRADQAKDHLGEYCLVEITVRRTGKNQSTRFFLNSLDDFRDPNCFTVTFEKPVLEQLKQRGLVDIESFFLNKTLRVRGIVTKYVNPRDNSKSIQIDVDDVGQFQFP